MPFGGGDGPVLGLAVVLFNSGLHFLVVWCLSLPSCDCHTHQTLRFLTLCTCSVSCFHVRAGSGVGLFGAAFFRDWASVKRASVVRCEGLAGYRRPCTQCVDEINFSACAKRGICRRPLFVLRAALQKTRTRRVSCLLEDSVPGLTVNRQGKCVQRAC